MEILWKSNSNTIFAPFRGTQRLEPNQILATQFPLFNKSETYQLLFNDVVGQLQIWKRGIFHRITWESSKVISGEGPWTCALHGLGFLMILDKHRNVIWSSTYVNHFTHPRFLEKKNALGITPNMCTNQESSSAVYLHLSDEGQLQLWPAPDTQRLPFWHSTLLQCPPSLLEIKEVKPNLESVGTSAISPLFDALDWFEYNSGYKRVSSRLCLMGFDFLLSHQKLYSLTSAWSLELLPIPESSRETKSILFLNPANVEVYYIIFEKSVSIFAPDLLQSTQLLKITILEKKDDTVKIENVDHPLCLWFRKKTLCLSTSTGKIIAKKNLKDLSDQRYVTVVS